MNAPDAIPRILELLSTIQSLARPGALLGDVPAMLLLSLIGQAMPDRRVVTLDGRQALSQKQIQEACQASLAPNSLLLVILTPLAGGEIVRLLEELLQENRLPWSDPEQTLPASFRLLVHSPAGLFPFYECIPLRVRI